MEPMMDFGTNFTLRRYKMEVKDLLAKEYALRHTKLQEDFEEGQPELLGDSTILHSGPQSPEVTGMMDRAKAKYEKFGAQMADKYSDMIMEDARRILSTMYNSKNIDVKANASRSEYDSEDDYIEDADELMELTVELSRSFLDGMEQAWFYPLNQ